MNINQKIAKIPFWILYGIIAFLTIFSFIYTYAHMDYPRMKEGNPANHFLALTFSETFHIDYKYYFLCSIPFVLLLLYGALKLAKFLVKAVDKRTDIKGDNHAAMIVILAMGPNVLHQIIVTVFGVYLIGNPGAEFKYTNILGIGLAAIYLILAEFISEKPKKVKK